jgi:hypothetical protein
MSKILDIKKRIRQKKVKRASFDGPMEIRDAREKEFFIIDDAYFNGFAKVCGVMATAVYMGLCRHAGKDQTCFPSVELMGARLGAGKSSIMRGLRELETHKIIKVDRLQGQPNIYTLLNKKHWKKFLPVVGESGMAIKKARESRLLVPCGDCVDRDSEKCLGCQGGSMFKATGL